MSGKNIQTHLDKNQFTARALTDLPLTLFTMRSYSQSFTTMKLDGLLRTGSAHTQKRQQCIGNQAVMYSEIFWTCITCKASGLERLKRKQ